MLQAITAELHIPVKLCDFKRQLNASASGVHACPEPGCDRQFKRKCTLAEHSKTYTDKKPRMCPVSTCAKRFSTSGNLSRHKRLHRYIDPLKYLASGCTCTLPSNKLEKHIKFHYSTASTTCSLLRRGKIFSTMGNLNHHLKNHHDDRDCATSQLSVGKDLPIGRPRSTTEQWGRMAPVEEFALWPEECFAPMDSALEPTEARRPAIITS